MHGIQVPHRSGTPQDERRLRISNDRRAIRTIPCRGPRTPPCIASIRRSPSARTMCTSAAGWQRIATTTWTRSSRRRSRSTDDVTTARAGADRAVGMTRDGALELWGGVECTVNRVGESVFRSSPKVRPSRSPGGHRSPGSDWLSRACGIPSCGSASRQKGLDRGLGVDRRAAGAPARGRHSAGGHAAPSWQRPAEHASARPRVPRIASRPTPRQWPLDIPGFRTIRPSTSRSRRRGSARCTDTGIRITATTARSSEPCCTSCVRPCSGWRGSGRSTRAPG